MRSSARTPTASRLDRSSVRSTTYTRPVTSWLSCRTVERPSWLSKSQLEKIAVRWSKCCRTSLTRLSVRSANWLMYFSTLTRPNSIQRDTMMSLPSEPQMRLIGAKRMLRVQDNKVPMAVLRLIRALVDPTMSLSRRSLALMWLVVCGQGNHEAFDDQK